MRVFIVFELLLVLISGCAFKESSQVVVKKVLSQTKIVPQSSVACEFFEQKSGLDVGERTNVNSFLIRNKQSHDLEAQKVLFLPAIVPDSIMSRLSILEMPLGTSGLTGEIKLDQKLVREIPSAAFVVKSAGSMTDSIRASRSSISLPSSHAAKS